MNYTSNKIKKKYYKKYSKKIKNKNKRTIQNKRTIKNKNNRKKYTSRKIRKITNIKNIKIIIGGFMTGENKQRDYTSGANDFQRKILDNLFPDYNIWQENNIIPPEMVIWERRLDTGNFDLIYDKMSITNYCINFKKNNLKLINYVKDLYSKQPILIQFDQAISIIRDANITTPTEEDILIISPYPINFKTSVIDKFKIAIGDDIFQISRMLNAINIYFQTKQEYINKKSDGFKIIAENDLCNLNIKDTVFDNYFNYHKKDTFVGNNINTPEACNFVKCRFNIMLTLMFFELINATEMIKNSFIIKLNTYSKEFNEIITNLKEKEKEILQQSIITNTLLEHRKTLETHEGIYSEIITDDEKDIIKPIVIQELEKELEKEFNTKTKMSYIFNYYTNNVNQMCFEYTQNIIKTLRTPVYISLQNIYSLLILMQGDYYLNQYLGKVWIPEVANLNGFPNYTPGIKTSELKLENKKFIQQNSAKINSLFDLGPLNNCASNSKPMIENYLKNDKSCFISINEKNQIVFKSSWYRFLTYNLIDTTKEPIIYSII